MEKPFCLTLFVVGQGVQEYTDLGPDTGGWYHVETQVITHEEEQIRHRYRRQKVATLLANSL